MRITLTRGNGRRSASRIQNVPAIDPATHGSCVGVNTTSTNDSDTSADTMWKIDRAGLLGRAGARGSGCASSLPSASRCLAIHSGAVVSRDAEDSSTFIGAGPLAT